MRLCTGIALLYACLTATVALVVLFCAGPVDYYLKSAVARPLASPLFLAAAALLVFAALYALLCRRSERTGRSALWRLPLAGALPLFAVQVFVCYHAYFLGDGCDSFYVLNSAYSIAFRLYDFVEAEYLSLYPNNMALAVLFGMLLRLFHLVFGAEPSMERFRLMLILLQILLNQLTGLLLVFAAHRVTHSVRLAHIAWVLHVVLIGLSPWFLVPYSDSMTLILPLLMLTLYLCRGRHDILRFACIGLLGGLGALIKPQACIPAIAILIVELLQWATQKRRAPVQLLVMLAALWLALFPGASLIRKAAHVPALENKSVTFAHYLNMGLNPETDGAYSAADLGLALSQPSQEAQMQFCLESARQRVRSLGVSGMLEHALHKALVNFADGSFAWCIDFTIVPLPEKDAALSPLIRSIVYPDGALYPWLKTLQQGCWLLLLVLAPFSALYLIKERSAGGAALLLSAIGILCFNMLFEAKARYMYIYAPVWILLAAAALRHISLPGVTARLAGLRKA